MKTLVIGGAGSGKSEIAEALCLAQGKTFTYLATMEPFGDEAQQRIKRHRDIREGKGFQTLECPRDLASQVSSLTGTVLLECLGTLVANEMFVTANFDSLEEKIMQGMDILGSTADHLVVVTNDVFGDGITYPDETRAYQEVLASLNRSLAASYDNVVEVVCGIPCWHKGANPCV